MMASKDIHVLITRAYEYVTLSDKRDLAGVIKDLKMGTVFSIIQWTQCDHKCFYTREI